MPAAELLLNASTSSRPALELAGGAVRGSFRAQ